MLGGPALRRSVAAPVHRRVAGNRAGIAPRVRRRANAPDRYQVYRSVDRLFLTWVSFGLALDPHRAGQRAKRPVLQRLDGALGSAGQDRDFGARAVFVKAQLNDLT